MRVNSAHKILFGNLLVNKFVVASVLVAIFFTASSFTTPGERELRAKQANLIIREIGHRLLLQSGDFTSRVLPVKEMWDPLESTCRHASLSIL